MDIKEVTIKELKEIIEFADKQIPKSSILLYGRAGIGKSTIINSISNKKIFDIRAVLIDIGDLVTKVPDVDNKILTNYYCETFKKIIETAKKQDVILLLDEFTQATIPVLRMFYQIILDRKLENLIIPDNVQIIAISNTSEDLDNTDIIAEKPLWDRFNFRVQLEISITEWTEWALNNNIDIKIISFLNNKPEYLHYENDNELKVTPRRWEYINKIMKQDYSSLLSESILGNEVGVMLNAFINITEKFNIKKLLEKGISKLTEDEKYMALPLLTNEISKEYKTKNYNMANNQIKKISNSLIADQYILFFRFLINKIATDRKEDRKDIKEEIIKNLPIIDELLYKI